MKVLMTVDAVGGVWTYALELSRALAHHDVHVALACMGPAPSESQLASVHALPNVTLSWCDCKLEWMNDPWQDVDRAGDWLLRLAARERPDIVQVNGYVHAALPWQRPVICVAHSCVYSWWQAVHRCEPPPEWQSYRERVSAGLDRADCIIAPTHAFLGSIAQLYRPTTRAHVIHNARTLGNSTRPTHQRLPVIFACGRAWDRAKGIDVLDAAARDLPWRGYVAGPAADPDGVPVRLQSLRTLGTLSADELDIWLRRAAIFAHPARYEPFGLAVLEAALGGCALVLADVPTLRELWQDAALFVPVDDAWTMRRTLQRLIANPDCVAVLGSASWARAQRYRPQIMAAKYFSLYRELLAETRHRPREVA